MAKSTFSFTGEILMPRKTEDFYKSWTKPDARGKNRTLNSIRFGVKENNRNVGYVSLLGYEMGEIYSFDTNGNKLMIDWNDRLNPEVAPNVAYYKKYRINLGEEYGGAQEFVAQYDAIEFLNEWLPQYHGKIKVTGSWEKNAYNGKITDRFILQNVYAVHEDEKNQLKLSMELYYNSDSVDTKELASEGKIYIDGYISQYMKDIGNVYFHQNVVLCNKAYDLNNEKHLKIWEFKKSYFEKLSSKKMYKLTWDARYLNGAEEVEFDDTMLTEQQKMMIDLGLTTIDEYRPKGGIYGVKITEVRLAAPKLSGDFKEGALECDEKPSEFQEKVFAFAKEEKLEDIIKEDVADEEEISESDEDLF